MATPTKENVFDENGQTIETVEADPTAEAPDTEAPAEAVAEAPKYRIGERTFTTQDEALAYAQSQVSALETETQVADAYRQGLRDAVQPGTLPAAGVTPVEPAAPALNPEELYTNPQDFLRKYAQQIKSEVTGEINQQHSLKTQSDAIWNEFTMRHPDLAEFRTEVETFVGAQQTEVRAIIGTKGRPASYDWIATKLKSRFEAYANAVKPNRALPNGGAGASPTQKAAGVTPPAAPKKPITFSEQVRSLRRKQR